MIVFEITVIVVFYYGTKNTQEFFLLGALNNLYNGLAFPYFAVAS